MRRGVRKEMRKGTGQLVCVMPGTASIQIQGEADIGSSRLVIVYSDW